MNNSLYEITQKQEDKSYVKNDEWISIKIVNKDENVDIVFSDSGRALSKEERMKIFQPFYSTKPVGSGTGLSLTVSRKILEFNNGELRIDEEAEHTTFIVTLPTKPIENKI